MPVVFMDICFKPTTTNAKDPELQPDEEQLIGNEVENHRDEVVLLLRIKDTGNVQPIVVYESELKEDLYTVDTNVDESCNY